MIKYIVGGNNIVSATYSATYSEYNIKKRTPLFCTKVEVIPRDIGNSIDKTYVKHNGATRKVRNKVLKPTLLDAYLYHKKDIDSGADISKIEWLLEYIETNHAEYLI